MTSHSVESGDQIKNDPPQLITCQLTRTGIHFLHFYLSNSVKCPIVMVCTLWVKKVQLDSFEHGGQSVGSSCLRAQEESRGETWAANHLLWVTRVSFESSRPTYKWLLLTVCASFRQVFTEKHHFVSVTGKEPPARGFLWKHTVFTFSQFPQRQKTIHLHTPSYPPPSPHPPPLLSSPCGLFNELTLSHV